MTDENAPTDADGLDTNVETPEAVNEDDQTGGQDESQTAEADPDGDAEDKKRESSKERRERDKAYKQRLRDELEAERDRAEKAEARRAKILQAGGQEKPPAEGDFADYAEYVAAKAVWALGKSNKEQAASDAGMEAEAARSRAKQIQAAERQIVDQSWQQQVVEARAKYADFDQVALDNSVPITPAVADLIKTSDAAADVAYHLGRNKALAAEIAKLPPIEAARAIGRIEASLTAPKPRTSTNAPQPINPVKGNATGTKDPEKMSMAEYIAGRRAGKIR